MVSKILRVDLVCGIDPLDPGVENFQRRHHEIGGVEHVEHRAMRPGQPLLHDEGEFGLDPGGDEAIGRHQAAIGEKHVVEQHAGIRLVDIERALHRLRGQADLVALDDAALGDLDLDPGLLDGIGVRDGDAGMFKRDLADLLFGLFGLMQPLGGGADIVCGQCHAWSKPVVPGSAKSGC